MGFFGGLAQGLGPALYAKKKQKHDEELERHREQIEFYTKISQRPDLKPNEMAMILKSLGDLAQNDPTSKKGKKGEQNILHQLSDIVGGLKSEGEPNLDKYKGTDERPRKVSDVPKKPGTAFFTPSEMGKRELEEKGPLEGFKVENAIKKAQELEDEKEANREKIAKYNWDRRTQIEDKKIKAKQEGKLPELASAIMAKAELEGNPISMQEAMGLAGKEFVQGLQDKHNDFIRKRDDTNSLVKTRVANLKIAIDKLNEYKIRTKIYAQSVQFRQQTKGLEDIYKTAIKSWTSANSELQALFGTKEKLLSDANKAGTTQTPEQAKRLKSQLDEIDEKIGEKQKALDNASTAIEQSTNEINKLSGYNKPSEEDVGDITTKPIIEVPKKDKGKGKEDVSQRGKVRVLEDGTKIKIKKVVDGNIVDYDIIK